MNFLLLPQSTNQNCGFIGALCSDWSELPLLEKETSEWGNETNPIESSLGSGIYGDV